MPDEHDFLRNPEDGYALYQLKPGKETDGLRFAAMEELETDVSHANYRMVYTGSLPENSWMIFANGMYFQAMIPAYSWYHFSDNGLFSCYDVNEMIFGIDPVMISLDWV